MIHLGLSHTDAVAICGADTAKSPVWHFSNAATLKNNSALCDECHSLAVDDPAGLRERERAALQAAEEARREREAQRLADRRAGKKPGADKAAAITVTAAPPPAAKPPRKAAAPKAPKADTPRAEPRPKAAAKASPAPEPAPEPAPVAEEASALEDFSPSRPAPPATVPFTPTGRTVSPMPTKRPMPEWAVLDANGEVIATVEAVDAAAAVRYGRTTCNNRAVSAVLNA